MDIMMGEPVDRVSYFNPDVSKALEKVIYTGLETDYEFRWQNAQELLEQLQKVRIKTARKNDKSRIWTEDKNDIYLKNEPEPSIAQRETIKAQEDKPTQGIFEQDTVYEQQKGTQESMMPTQRTEWGGEDAGQQTGETKPEKKKWLFPLIVAIDVLLIIAVIFIAVRYFSNKGTADDAVASESETVDNLINMKMIHPRQHNWICQ